MISNLRSARASRRLPNFGFEKPSQSREVEHHVLPVA
jgi:hypothetical protein